MARILPSADRLKVLNSFFFLCKIRIILPDATSHSRTAQLELSLLRSKVPGLDGFVFAVIGPRS